MGAGGGAGKERKRLPLSPDILPNAVRQRTGGNDVLPLVNRLSIKPMDQNDIRLTVYQNMDEAQKNSLECPFDQWSQKYDNYWKQNWLVGELVSHTNKEIFIQTL